MKRGTQLLKDETMFRSMVKTYRQSNHLTFAALARQCHVSETSIRGIEEGRNIGPKVIFGVLDGLNIREGDHVRVPRETFSYLESGSHKPNFSLIVSEARTYDQNIQRRLYLKWAEDLKAEYGRKFRHT